MLFDNTIQLAHSSGRIEKKKHGTKEEKKVAEYRKNEPERNKRREPQRKKQKKSETEREREKDDNDTNTQTETMKIPGREICILLLVDWQSVS